MKTAQEMKRAIHARTRELRHRQKKVCLCLLAGASFALCAILVALIGSMEGPWHRTLSVNYAGATMLFENAGGYVLVAVVAFMAGVVIAVSCLYHRRKLDEDKDIPLPKEGDPR